VSWFSYDKLI
jgi:hypothetical protein